MIMAFLFRRDFAVFNQLTAFHVYIQSTQCVLNVSITYVTRYIRWLTKIFQHFLKQNNFPEIGVVFSNFLSM